MSINYTKNQCKTCCGAGKKPILVEAQIAGYTEENCEECKGKGYF